MLNVKGYRFAFFLSGSETFVGLRDFNAKHKNFLVSEFEMHLDMLDFNALGFNFRPSKPITVIYQPQRFLVFCNMDPELCWIGRECKTKTLWIVTVPVQYRTVRYNNRKFIFFIFCI